MGIFSSSNDFEKFKNINIDETNEKVVVLLGLTGAGKSSFINGIVGRNECEIGDETKSCTKKLQMVNFLKDGINYYFIDTPGFDDANLKEEEIIKILNELKNYPRICSILICLKYNDTKLSNSVMNVLKHIMKIFPDKDFWEHTSIIRTWCQMDDEELKYHKEKYKGKLLEGIKDSPNLIKFMKENGINTPLNLNEFYVNSSPPPIKIKQRTQEEYQRILIQIRSLLPIYKDVKTQLREETFVTKEGEITFVKIISYKDYTFTDFNNSEKKISKKINEERYNLNSIIPSLTDVKRIQDEKSADWCPWAYKEHQYYTHYNAIKIYDLNHKEYRQEYEIICRKEYKNNQAEEEGEKYKEYLLDLLKKGPDNISYSDLVQPKNKKNSGKHSIYEEK